MYATYFCIGLCSPLHVSFQLEQNRLSGFAPNVTDRDSRNTDERHYYDDCKYKQPNCHLPGSPKYYP